MSRLGPLDPATMTPEQQKQVDVLLGWRKPLPDGTNRCPFVPSSLCG